MTKYEAGLLHTVVTQPLGHGTVFTIPAELDKGAITAAPALPARASSVHHLL
jgi:hypothetical protein